MLLYRGSLKTEVGTTRSSRLFPRSWPRARSSLSLAWSGLLDSPPFFRMVVLSTILKPKPKFPVGFKERARGGDWHEHERFMLLKGKHINPSATTLLVTIAYKASSFLTDSGDAIFLSREGCRRKLSTSDKIISALAMDHRRTAVDHHIMRHHCPSTTEIVIHTTTSPLTPSRVGFISPISRGILVNRRRAKLHV